jgi:hypothetical protein
MNRPRCRKKTTVEACDSISTVFLKKYGYLNDGYIGDVNWTIGQGSLGFWISLKDWTGTIHFRCAQSTTENEILDCPVQLVATPCNYGSKRWWFVCPEAPNGISCNRRVLKLYLRDGKYFGCRHCCNLTYASAQEHDQRVDDLIRDPRRFLGPLNSFGGTLLILKAMIKLAEKERKIRNKNNCSN